jgi:HEXXH motif-containing protein
VRRHGAQLALAMQAAGHAGGFRAGLDVPVPLRFDRWLLPAANDLAVEGDGERVKVDLDGQRAATFARDGDESWALADGSPSPLAQTRVLARSISFLPPAAVDDERDEELAYDVVPADDVVVGAWSAALALIGRAEPRYLGWVDRGIRDVVPLAVPGGTMISGSRTRRWGEVFMTSVLGPLELAEMLVHEVSHQHYFLGLMVSPVHDGSDETLYYSPLKRRGRPIDKILLGYHAFANVVLFYRACRARGIETHVEEAKILPELAELEAPLRTTHALTELGRAIWEPLAERLEATREGVATPPPGPPATATPSEAR